MTVNDGQVNFFILFLGIVHTTYTLVKYHSTRPTGEIPLNPLTRSKILWPRR